MMNEMRGIENVRVLFRTSDDERYDGGGSTLLGDILWLRIGSTRVETVMVPFPRTSRRFLNFPYPPPQQNEESEDILPLFRGYQAYRTSSNSPWLPMARLFDQLLAARTITWGFGVLSEHRDNFENLPRNWRSGSYRVVNSALRSALDWCDHNIDSPAARTLPE
jgi:hypothetical protein